MEFIRAATVAVFMSAMAPTAWAGAFDPSDYLRVKAIETLNPELLGMSIYRINGIRYNRVDTTIGSVYLPTEAGFKLMNEDSAVCPAHLGRSDEIFLVRRSLPIEALAPRKDDIIQLVRMCETGKLRAPMKLISQDPW